MLRTKYYPYNTLPGPIQTLSDAMVNKIEKFIAGPDFKFFVAKNMKIKNAVRICGIRMLHLDFEGWASFLGYIVSKHNREGSRQVRFSVRFDTETGEPMEFTCS